MRAGCVRSEESRRHLLPTLHGASAEANCGDRMDNMQASARGWEWEGVGGVCSRDSMGILSGGSVGRVI